MHPSRQPMQVRNSLTLDRGGSNPLKTGATAEGVPASKLIST